MLIKDLISQLEALYNEYTDADKAILGEPEIVIDVFKRVYPDSCNFLREYAGYSGFIKIERSNDGVYPILSAFYETQTYSPEYQTQEPPGPAWPKEESWET